MYSLYHIVFHKGREMASRVLAIIPARGGSKGLPRKNIINFDGKPLIAWTIEASLNSKYITKTVVSSDDDEILNISKQHGSDTIKRPSDLASDNATSASVVKHAIDYLSSNGEEFDILILLQPTSPLRKDNDIDEMLKLLIEKESEFDSIISIGEVSEHPSIMKKIINNNIVPYYRQLESKTRRQDNTPAYFPYGVAYIAKCKSLLSEKTIYTARSTYYLIERFQCYEIDDIYDFLTIETIMKHKKECK